MTSRPRSTSSPSDALGADLAGIKQRLAALEKAAHRHDTPNSEYVRLNAAYFPVQTLYFTSSGTFTKGDYPWLRAIKVICIGGGGGGGGVLSQTNRTAVGQSASGGGYCHSFITDIAGLASSITVTRGVGGAGGAAGANSGFGGGASSFGSLVSAPGGIGGLLGDASAFFGGTSIFIRGAGPQTTGFVGDYQVIGGAAGHGWTGGSNFAVSGVGGHSGMGYGSGGTATGSISDSLNGTVGRAHGGGGSGATGANNGTNRAGGNGAVGIVIVELFA